MKKPFRFPRTMILLMALTLVGLIFAIERARDIAIHQTATGADFITATLAALLVPVYVLATVGGVLGFTLYFAAKRSGAHRLSNLHTRPHR